MAILIGLVFNLSLLLPISSVRVQDLMKFYTAQRTDLDVYKMPESGELFQCSTICLTSTLRQQSGQRSTTALPITLSFEEICAIYILEINYSSGSQPVVHGPLVIRSHLPGGQHARPNR